MRLPALRRATAVLIGAALTLAANLPPQHGHPYRPGHAAVVHRHASLHVAADPTHPRLGDSDGAIIWINGSYVPETATTFAPRDAAMPDAVLHAPVFARHLARLDANATPIHGPPRGASGPRAPPRHL